MKKFQKILCLLMALTVFMCMAMGSGSSDESEGTSGLTSTQASNVGSEAIAIDEQVLLDRDGVKVTATEYVEDSIWGEGIKILVENTSEKNIGVNCNAVIVNNFMITDLFSTSVAAGKKANDTIYLSSGDLEAAGIDNVGQVELYFHAYNSDTYDTIFDADVVTVKTTAFEQMDTTVSEEGIVLYDANDVKVMGRYVSDDSFWGAAVLLYLENNTEKNIVVSCENMSINGFMVTPYFHGDVYAGKMAVDEITILSSDLEENGITDIEDIEVSFHIYDSDTYDTIADSEPVSITVG